MACKYVKEFQFGGKVSNSPAPKKYADGGKVKSGLAAVERMSPQEKRATLDGIARGARGDDKPGMIGRTIQAVRDKAIEKSPSAMRMIGITRDDEGEGYAKGGPVTKHQQMAAPDAYKRGGLAMGKRELPRPKPQQTDPSIRAFKKPSRRSKA
jgi:hypothetical protein